MIFQHLRDLREDNNLTQTQVAEILHIKQTTYSGYESGAHRIPIVSDEEKALQDGTHELFQEVDAQ